MRTIVIVNLTLTLFLLLVTTRISDAFTPAFTPASTPAFTPASTHHPFTHRPFTFTHHTNPTTVTQMNIHGPLHLEDFTSLDRVKIRIDGFGTYAVVSALILNACLRVFTSTTTTTVSKISPDGTKVLTTPLSSGLFLSTTALTFLQALHSTIVFTLVPIYAKTCLGLGLDAAFTKFLVATSLHRKIGFNCFVGSISTFLLAFSSAFYIKVVHLPMAEAARAEVRERGEVAGGRSHEIRTSRGGRALVGMTALGGLSLLLAWRDIMRKAQSIIFSPIV